MDAPTITSTPEVTGQAETPSAPQATETPAQAGSQPQTTPIVPVENNNQPLTQETPRASEFETARQIKRLAKQMQSLQQIIENNSRSAPNQSVPSQPQRPNVTQDELLKDPLGTIQKMIELQNEKVLGMVSQNEQTMRHKRDVEEGWKVIGSSNVYKNDPEGEDRINQILMENNGSLQRYSEVDPVDAAKLALVKYEQRYSSRSPQTSFAPTKAQMVSTATATYPNGAKVNINEEALKLQQEAYNNPDVMRDPLWKAKLAEITKQFNQQKIAFANEA